MASTGDRDRSGLDLLLLLPTFVTSAWILLPRPWLRVSPEGVRAGHGPFTRARVAVADVALAGTYRVRPRRTGAERLPGDTELYGGWVRGCCWSGRRLTRGGGPRDHDPVV